MQTILRYTIIGFIISITYISSLIAQTPIYYHYDGAGNRDLRSITLSSTKSAKVDSSESILTPKKLDFIQDSLGEKKIFIYPNPTQGQLRVDIEGYAFGNNSMIYIYNLAGAQMLRKSPVTSSNLLDLSGYPNGTYILCVIIGDKKTEWKIIKN